MHRDFVIGLKRHKRIGKKEGENFCSAIPLEKGNDL
jgi:hypothetical protein